jgi:hypothetical protein
LRVVSVWPAESQIQDAAQDRHEQAQKHPDPLLKDSNCSTVSAGGKYGDKYREDQNDSEAE